MAYLLFSCTLSRHFELAPGIPINRCWFNREPMKANFFKASRLSPGLGFVLFLCGDQAIQLSRISVKSSGSPQSLSGSGKRLMWPKIFFLFGAWLCTTYSAWAAPTDADKPVSLGTINFRSGIIDPVANTVYLRHKTDAMEAVNLTTGDVLWESRLAFLPLAAAGNRLAALGLDEENKGVPLILVLDVGGKGKPQVYCDELPAEAWLAEKPRSGSFATGRIEDGKLLVRWSSGSSPFQGAAPRPEQFTWAVGEAQVDLDNGKVKIIRNEKGTGMRLLSEKKEPALDETLPPPLALEIEALKVMVWPTSPTATGMIRAKPIPLGDKFVLVFWEKIPAGGTKLILRSWDRDTGKPRDPMLLGEGVSLTVLSHFEEFVFVQDVGPQWPVESRREALIWVVSLKSGKVVAKLNYAQAAEPVCLLGDRLYLIHGSSGKRALCCVELSSRREIWSRPVFEYFYDGAFPP